MEMTADIKKLDKLREGFTEFKATNQDIGISRTVLQVEGPDSQFFRDTDDKFVMSHVAVWFEYYWINLAYLMKNGSFLFPIQYLAFSL